MLPSYRLPKRGLGEGWNMRVDPMFIDCVAFVCARNRSGKVEPGGTAFFVEVVDDDDLGRRWTYLVTAAHNLEESIGQEIYVRINTTPNARTGVEYKDERTLKDDWFKHWNADVAAIVAPHDPQPAQRVPLSLSVGRDYRYDLKAFDNKSGQPILESALLSTYRDGIQVEVGHDLFFPGLFVESAGKKRNLPIVRFGNVSRMPGDELITIRNPVTRTTRQIKGYLAEFHSWGGHSGSPVFWHYEYNIAIPINVPLWRAPRSALLIDNSTQSVRVDVQVKRGFVIGLLGLVSAHFDVDSTARDKRRQTHRNIIPRVNAGTAVITPAENIRELLMSDEMKEDRRRRIAEMEEEEPAAVADFAPGKERKTRDIPIPPISRNKFFGALEKASSRKREKK
jgi:hypothetical protein